MPIFAVIALNQGNSDQLGNAVQQKFSDNSFKVAQGHWLINTAATTQQISKELGISGGPLGQVIVYNAGGYFGYAPNTVWEWLKTNMTAGGASG